MTKPALVVTDLTGYHAQNLPETAVRLHRGGSWAKQRTIVILPSADMVPMKCVMSWWGVAFPPNNGVVKIAALGDEVGVAYSSAIEQVLANPELSQWEYICTIEHDNTVPGDGIIKLIERIESNPEFSCISALYFTKGMGGCAQIWGDVTDPVLNFRPQVPRTDGGLQECVGTGMGLAIWKLSMFKDERIKRPWFRTLNGKDGTGVATQDLTFWSEARKYGYRCAVDTSVRSGHHDQAGTFGVADFTW